MISRSSVSIESLRAKALQRPIWLCQPVDKRLEHCNEAFAALAFVARRLLFFGDLVSLRLERAPLLLHSLPFGLAAVKADAPLRRQCFCVQLLHAQPRNIVGIDKEPALPDNRDNAALSRLVAGEREFAVAADQSRNSVRFRQQVEQPLDHGGRAHALTVEVPHALPRKPAGQPLARGQAAETVQIRRNLRRHAVEAGHHFAKQPIELQARCGKSLEPVALRQKRLVVRLRSVARKVLDEGSARGCVGAQGRASASAASNRLSNEGALRTGFSRESSEPSLAARRPKLKPPRRAIRRSLHRPDACGRAIHISRCRRLRSARPRAQPRRQHRAARPS